MNDYAKQPIHPQERRDAERRAHRPLPTDEDVMRFLKEEREYGMREELFGGSPMVDPIAAIRHQKEQP
jgi:hypothetical protein